MSQQKLAPSDNWFLNCIALVKRAPGMWVPTKSARELDLFFLGYMKARHDLGVQEYGTDEDDLLESFRDWLCAKMGLPVRVGWVHCIEQLDGKQDNVQTFIGLFEEFLVHMGRTLPEANPEQWVGVAADEVS